jgi:hypothetical protein
MQNAGRLLRKQRSEQVHNLYSSPNTVTMIKSRSVRWTGHAARMAVKRTAYRILVGKPEEKRPLGRLRRRWDDNINTDLKRNRMG